jgi:hypothetical protein
MGHDGVILIITRANGLYINEQPETVRETKSFLYGFASQDIPIIRPGRDSRVPYLKQAGKKPGKFRAKHMLAHLDPGVLITHRLPPSLIGRVILPKRIQKRGLVVVFLDFIMVLIYKIGQKIHTEPLKGYQFVRVLDKKASCFVILPKLFLSVLVKHLDFPLPVSFIFAVPML